MADRMDVFAVHVLAKEEVQPVLTGDFLLVDSETGERLDVTASRRLVENYQRRCAASVLPCSSSARRAASPSFRLD